MKTDLKESLKDLRELMDQKFVDTLDDVHLDGRRLDEGLKTQLVLEYAWQIVHSKAKTLKDYAEFVSEEAYAIALKAEMNDSYRDVSITEAKEYAKINPQYKQSRIDLIYARELYEESKGVMEVVTSRKYTLNNLTKTTIAEVNNHII